MSKFYITEKQFDFIHLQMKELMEYEDFPEGIHIETDEDKEKYDKAMENMFIKLCDKILDSNDPEIKIELSRTFMYMGFRKHLSDMAEAISQYISSMEVKQN